MKKFTILNENCQFDVNKGDMKYIKSYISNPKFEKFTKIKIKSWSFGYLKKSTQT